MQSTETEKSTSEKILRQEVKDELKKNARALG